MNNNIANCPRCGRVFARGARDVCVSCVKEIEREYERCVEFLREYRGATIQEVSEATEVSVKQITKFIREGRISLMNAPNLGYPCESCGTPIRTGNLCDDCRHKFTKQAEQIQQELLREDGARQSRSEFDRAAFEINSSKKPRS